MCIVLLGTSLEIRSDMRRTYAKSARIFRESPRQEFWTEVDRPFTFNLHLGGLWLFEPQIPSNWIQVVEKTNRRVSVVWPSIDTVGWICSWPAAVMIFGYSPTVLILSLIVRRAARTRSQPELNTAMHTCTRLAMTGATPGACLWLVVLIASGAGTVLDLPYSGPLFALPEILSVGLFVLPMLAGWLRLVTLDTARLVFPIRLSLASALILTNILGPVLALRLLAF
jgi:hypothetical protein